MMALRRLGLLGGGDAPGPLAHAPLLRRVARRLVVDHGALDHAARRTFAAADDGQFAADPLEHLDLLDRVLPNRGVEHEQNRMGRRRFCLFHHADDLFEFVH